MLPNGVLSTFSHFKSCGWLHSDLPGRGKIPLYNLLRIFGCLAYTHLPWNSDNGHCWNFKYYQPKCMGNTTSGCSGSIVNWSDHFTTTVSGCSLVVLQEWIKAPSIYGVRYQHTWITVRWHKVTHFPNIQTYCLARAGSLMIPCTSIFMYIHIKHISWSIYLSMCCAENN